MSIPETEMNTAIICVDDEPGIREAYLNTLTASQHIDNDTENLLSRRKRRKQGHTETTGSGRKELVYEIFTAASGEEAVEIVREQLAKSRQIAAGFFDMSMPGGIDGAETIKRILELDNQMLCAVVTAYTDRSTKQLGNLFSRQDDWLYFNKPFSSGELEQTAYHLVTAWNQRRREESLVSNLEMMQTGLMWILRSVSNINRVPPLVMEALVEGLLKHYLNLAGAENGFIFVPSGDEIVQYGQGVFEDCNNLADTKYEQQWKMARSVMLAGQATVIDGTMAATPLFIADEPMGVLFVQKDKAIEHDSKLFDMYASQAVNMIQHSNLYEVLNLRNLELNQKNRELVDLLDKLTQSEHLQEQFKKLSLIDTLTNLPNRRYIETKLQENFEQARREGTDMACVMLDIDHFKQINDTYGHPAGDYVLQQIGLIFRDQKRPDDLVSRYGGEEFLMLYVDINPEDSHSFCERLRRSVEATTFIFDRNRINVTVSVGCHVFNPKKGGSLESVIVRADHALYSAKRAGRNRCVISIEDSPEQTIVPEMLQQSAG